MKLDRLWIGDFKNLRDVTVEFDENHLMTVIVGWNGAGKSNVIEALVVIFRDLDLGNAPPFPYELTYRIGDNRVTVKTIPDNEKTVTDQYEITLVRENADQLIPAESKIGINKFKRSGGGEFLPKHVFAYYSGPSQRLEGLFKTHQERFYRALLENREGMEEPLRPLFYARPIHSQFVLLAFFLGEEDTPRQFLEKYLGIVALDSVLFVMKKPGWAKSKRQISLGDKRFWGSRGVVQSFLRNLYEVALAPIRVTRRVETGLASSRTEELLYLFVQDSTFLKKLAQGLTASAFFKMLESTYISDVVSEVRIRVQVKGIDGALTFRELSEGEQQLLTVLGLLRFTGEADSLFLLDEPDTHLNPSWAVKYLSFLRDFVPNQETSHIIMATHNPLAIAELERGQVQIMWRDEQTMRINASPPAFDPQGLGFAGILTSDMFGLESTLDEPTLEFLRERRTILEQDKLSESDVSRLEELNAELGKRNYSVVSRDPEYQEYLQARKEVISDSTPSEGRSTPEQLAKRRAKAREIMEKILRARGAL